MCAVTVFPWKTKRHTTEDIHLSQGNLHSVTIDCAPWVKSCSIIKDLLEESSFEWSLTLSMTMLENWSNVSWNQVILFELPVYVQCKWTAEDWHNDRIIYNRVVSFQLYWVWYECANSLLEKELLCPLQDCPQWRAVCPMSSYFSLSHVSWLYKSGCWSRRCPFWSCCLPLRDLITVGLVTIFYSSKSTHTSL